MDRLAQVLTHAGFQARKPKGSFFLYTKAPATAAGDDKQVQFNSAEEASQWLITEKFVSTVPWEDAGAYLRFSVTFVAKNREDEERIRAADRLIELGPGGGSQGGNIMFQGTPKELLRNKQSPTAAWLAARS